MGSSYVADWRRYESSAIFEIETRAFFDREIRFTIDLFDAVLLNDPVTAPGQFSQFAWLFKNSIHINCQPLIDVLSNEFIAGNQDCDLANPGFKNPYQNPKLALLRSGAEPPRSLNQGSDPIVTELSNQTGRLTLS